MLTACSPPPDWTGLPALRPVARRFLGRFSRDDEEIEDVVQEALLRAACNRHRLSDERRLRGWTLRIALNLLRTRARRERILPRAEVDTAALDLLEGCEEIPGDGPEQQGIELAGRMVERAAAFGHLEGALALLRPHERKLLCAWYGTPPGPARAALVCEGAPDLARVRAFRARRRVTRALLRSFALDPDVDPGPHGAGSWLAGLGRGRRA
jgi:RNA polymerase sigma factor (sigma-70 family)